MVTKINPTMTLKKINSILAAGGDIEFGAGTYKLKGTMILCSNSNIRCVAGTVFVKSSSKPMLQTSVSKKTTKYNGVHDVIWYGGRFDGDGNPAASNMVNLIHAKGIQLKNMVFENCHALHFVEIHACCGVEVNGCSFKNHIDTKGKEYKECVQIDFANYDGLVYADPGDPTYDGTHCSSIDIVGCVFENVTTCIGTHTVTTQNKQHSEILIRNCVARGRGTVGDYGVFARLLNMKNVFITGNTLKNFKEGVLIDRFKTGHKPSGGTEALGDYKRCSQICVRENTFVDVPVITEAK